MDTESGEVLTWIPRGPWKQVGQGERESVGHHGLEMASREQGQSPTRLAYSLLKACSLTSLLQYLAAFSFPGNSRLLAWRSPRGISSPAPENGSVWGGRRGVGGPGEVFHGVSKSDPMQRPQAKAQIQMAEETLPLHHPPRP